MPRRPIKLLMLFALPVWLAACATQPAAHPDNPAALVWPAAPEAARIAWLRSFARPEDLGIDRTFLQRLKDILFGATEVRLVRPMAVATMGKTIYVADPGAKGVHRFDTARGDYRLIQAEDGNPLPSPVGLARCGDTILATDSSSGRIYSLAGESGAHPLALDDKLIRPTGIACDMAHNRVYVSDTASHQIKRFRLGAGTLALEKVIGQRGTEPGQFNFPTYLWWSDAGRLYVSDALNFRIQILDGEGRAEGQFGKLGDGSGDAVRLKGVADDGRGHVYVVDSLFHAFQIFDAGGNYLLAVGSRGGDPGEFWLPTGIFVDHDLIYVADSYNRRVQVFRYLGGTP